MRTGEMEVDTEVHCRMEFCQKVAHVGEHAEDLGLGSLLAMAEITSLHEYSNIFFTLSFLHLFYVCNLPACIYTYIYIFHFIFLLRTSATFSIVFFFYLFKMCMCLCECMPRVYEYL